jgi:septum formation inhibitor-activating ATPase MinD
VGQEQNLEEGTTSKKLYLNCNGKRTLKDKSIIKIKDVVRIVTLALISVLTSKSQVIQ